MPARYMLGARREDGAERHHRRWLLLQLSQRGHARLSTLKSAQRYGPISSSVRQITMEDASLPTTAAVRRRGDCEGPCCRHMLYHAFEVQLLCCQGEFFCALPFSWVQLFTFMGALDESPKISVITSRKGTLSCDGTCQ